MNVYQAPQKVLAKIMRETFRKCVEIQASTITLGYPAEVDGETLFPKTPGSFLPAG